MTGDETYVAYRDAEVQGEEIGYTSISKIALRFLPDRNCEVCLRELLKGFLLGSGPNLDMNVHTLGDYRESNPDRELHKLQC